MRSLTLFCVVFILLTIAGANAGQRPSRPSKAEVTKLREQVKQFKLQNAKLRALLNAEQAHNRRAAEINRQMAQQNLLLLKASEQNPK